MGNIAGAAVRVKRALRSPVVWLLVAGTSVAQQLTK
jgi:hypothetical protein